MSYEVNPFEVKDYLQDMRSKRTYAFEEAVVFDKYLQLAAAASMELQEVFRALMQERSIDTAVGAQLDIIGEIVGQPRILVDSDIIPYFGYQGAVNVEGYGDLTGFRGGYYWDINVPRVGDTTLVDEVYRLFIKAKVFKNITTPTPDNVAEFIRFVFSIDRVRIIEDVGGNVELTLYSNTIGNFELTMLRYFIDKKYRSYFTPKALGVNYFIDVVNTTYDGTFLHDGEISY